MLGDSEEHGTYTTLPSEDDCMSLPETKVTKTLQNHAEQCHLCFIPLKNFGKKRSFSSIYFPVLLGGSAPPNVVNTIFLYLAIRGLLFRTFDAFFFKIGEKSSD